MLYAYGYVATTILSTLRWQFLYVLGLWIVPFHLPQDPDNHSKAWKNAYGVEESVREPAVLQRQLSKGKTDWESEGKRIELGVRRQLRQRGKERPDFIGWGPPSMTGGQLRLEGRERPDFIEWAPPSMTGVQLRLEGRERPNFIGWAPPSMTGGQLRLKKTERPDFIGMRTTEHDRRAAETEGKREARPRPRVILRSQTWHVWDPPFVHTHAQWLPTYRCSVCTCIKSLFHVWTLEWHT